MCHVTDRYGYVRWTQRVLGRPPSYYVGGRSSEVANITLYRFNIARGRRLWLLCLRSDKIPVLPSMLI